MLECKYVNSLGNTFSFNTENNRINKSDIRDYEWEYIERFNRIKTFNRSLKTRVIPVTFFNRKGRQYFNELYYKPQDLYAIADYDVRTLQPGKLYIGDYYIKCYISGSSKQKYDNGVVIVENLTILSDFNWRKEIERIYGASSPYEPTPEDVDYPYDYEWDYAIAVPPYLTANLTTDSVAPFNFRITFQGPIDVPELRVSAGGVTKKYRVYTNLYQGEHLTIDSLSKEIFVTKVNGDIENRFSSRDRENYIFDKMPVSSGRSLVMYREGYIVSLTAYIERSEPKWI